MTFYETAIFTAQITKLISDDSYSEFRQVLIAYPKSKQENITDEQARILRSLVDNHLAS